jgi:transglutaminase-like putative cysteine protease
MTQRHHIAIIAALATLLGSFPLSGVFANWTWFFYAACAVALVVGAAMLVRLARGPVWVQVATMAVTLLLFLTWIFPSGSELLGVLPTAATFSHFGQLFTTAGTQMRVEAAPVPDLDGLLLLSTLGVGVVAILVDLFAVGLRRPALAGLPMLAIYSVPVAVLPGGVSLVTFAVAAAGYLWLLVTDSVDRIRRFGRRFTGEGRDVDLWEPSPLASAGRRLGVFGVILAIFIPLALPAMTSLFDTRNGPGPGGPTDPNLQGPQGNVTTVNLNALITGNLQRDRSEDMVKLTTNDPAPYYLKLGVAEQAAEDGFHNVAPSGGDALARGLPDPVIGPGVIANSYHATVSLIALNMNLAPVYAVPTKVDGLPSDWFFDPATNQVYSRRSTAGGKTYEFDYVHQNYTEDGLRSAPPIPGGDATLTKLTSVPAVPLVQDIVDNLTKGQPTEYDAVRQLYNYFSPANGFRYSKIVPAGNTHTAIGDFLQVRQGFCVQYAAALAWMVRAAGYPARVAFGFTAGGTPFNGTYTLTSFNLHAWTEVYFPSFGWVPFDATPADSVTGSRPQAYAPSNFDNKGNPTPGPSGSEGFEKNTGAPNPGTGGGNPFKGALAFFGKLGPVAYGGGGALLVLLVGVFLPRMRRQALRRRRRVRSDQTVVLETGPDGSRTPNVRLAGSDLVLDPSGIEAARRDAHEAWAELLDSMIDYDVPVLEAETPRATAERLAGLPGFAGQAAGDTTLLARAEERARYALVPLRPDALDAAVSGVRHALRSGATRRQRFNAALLPRSVLLRWRLGLVRRTATVVTWSGRWRDRVVELASPRRIFTARR